MINIYNPNICDFSESAINAIKSGWISNHGEYVKKSTDIFRNYLNIKHVILMANGTCATHGLFIALKYKYPDLKKIYVPNNCYIAAWNCLLMEYDNKIMEVMNMDIDTWNIKTDENYIKSLDYGAAVLIVHNLGNVINVPRLKNMRPDLIFVEDNCEGLFGKYDNISSGTSESSLCASVSFYGNKIITTGEGGAFLTNDTDLYNYMAKVYSQGLSSTRYLHDVHAYNYRMTNVQAAFLYDQLNNIEIILANKKRIFDYYEELLQTLILNNKVKLFKKEENTQNSNWIFSLRIVDNPLTIEETYDFFRAKEIDTRPFFYPINKHGHLKDINFNDDISYKLNSEVLMIPSSPDITIKEQEYIVDCINQFIFYIDNKLKINIINDNNIELLKSFILNNKSNNFRYYNKRDISVIKNHLITLILTNDDNKSIGYAHIDNENNEFWFGICLLEDYQNKGLGTKIMNYIFNKKNITLIKNIKLTVDNDNFNAIKLYKKFGFIEENKESNFTKMIRNNYNLL
jgi:perosamine synthetase